MIWTLIIPGRPLTVNSIMKLVPHGRSDVKHPWRKTTALLAASDGFVMKRPVLVTATPHLKGNRKQDVGACYLIAKACIDGLTDAGCWPDDDDEHVEEIRLRKSVYGCESDSLVLTIEEVGG